jgi:hypothetical protein
MKRVLAIATLILAGAALSVASAIALTTPFKSGDFRTAEW